MALATVTVTRCGSANQSEEDSARLQETIDKTTNYSATFEGKLLYIDNNGAIVIKADASIVRVYIGEIEKVVE